MIPKPFAFVLMPFNPSFDDTYHLGIKPACEEAGYYCERLDEQIFEERMLDRIYNQISKADLIISDLSDRNPNVFYETGYAHALGKRVILLTKNGDDIPFDLKHHFHIIYSDGINSLKKSLKGRASFYLKNPTVSSLDPFDEVTAILNHVVIDLKATHLEVQAIRDWGGRVRGESISIVAEFHISPDSSVSSMDIDVRIITPRLFHSSGRYVQGDFVKYGTISMPNGSFIHKPDCPVSLSVGDPDSINFSFYTSEYKALAPYSKHRFVLRLISSKQIKDVELDITVVEENVNLG